MNLIYLTFLLLFLLNPLFSPVFAQNGKNSDAQKLLSFKSTLSNPKILVNWQENSNPCQFIGVFCNNNLRVTSLDFTVLPLSTDFTSVSTYLLSLELLTSLSMSFTNISGSVKKVPICSKNITQIDLSHNQISGSFFDISHFSSCSSLKSLNISYNLLDSTKKLNDGHFGLLLETLDVSGNLISGEEILPLVVNYGCEKLGYLAMKGNKLLGNFNLDKCSNLQHFDISSNNFSTKVPNFGKACTNLKYIDLSSNKFVGSIEDALIGCNNLSFLNVSNNGFNGEFPKFASTNLEYLYLGNNKFEGVIIDSVVDGICSNKLVEFDISFNNFYGMISTSFESCSLLETFDVSNNNFTGFLPMEILLKIGRLRKINLSFNKFIGTLNDSFNLFRNLETLDLSSNNITGKIPPLICENTGLKELYLQNNVLIGNVPSNLGNCSELVSIDLSFNYLNGSIPNSLGQLSKLKDLIMWKNLLDGEIPNELMNNKALENLILDYNNLSGGIPFGLKNCTNLNWISLSSNRLSGVIPSWIGSLNNLAILKLSSNLFYGAIPPELGKCKSLLWLDLNDNLLNGTIPPSLADQSGSMVVGLVVGKKFVYLRNAGGKECHGSGNLLEFAGIRSESLDRLSNPSCQFLQIYMGKTQPTFNHNGSMIFLDLSHNNLVGSIPKELGKMAYLSILNLGHNNFSGPIPDEMGGLRNIGVLDLSYNHLSGMIPQALASLTLLTEIDLSNNQLYGLIPVSAQFETFPPSRFDNNSGLCGYPLALCDNSSKSDPSQRQKHGRKVSLAGSVAIGLLISLFCTFGVIIIGVEIKKRRRQEGLQDNYMDGNSHSGNGNFAWKYTSKHEALSINLAAFEKPLRKLTFADLLEATNGFHDDSMIGKGGFGDVYKAQLKDGSVVAIKKLVHVGQGDREFMAEMETIGKIKHRNLVPLLGYCKVGEERLLVYEYMKHGSLDDVLHSRKKLGIKLDWFARRKIAIGAARGLAFLHHNCIPHIIHRDMKSSNVLVDENLEARVSDFGMARLMSAMDTHLSVSTLAGTPGYVPPEYYNSFRCSTKGDVYSYGVVLLELLTGRQPTDSVDFGDTNLVGWVKMHAKLKISNVFDPELIKEDPTLEIELLQHLKVAWSCLDDRPWKRPTMIQVMAMFKEIQAGSGLDSGSSITTDDGSFTTLGGSFNTVDVLADMIIKEVPEGNFK